MEEALKMRNLLQAFMCKHDGSVRFPGILGIREHIFTDRYLLSEVFLIYD